MRFLLLSLFISLNIVSCKKRTYSALSSQQEMTFAEKRVWIEDLAKDFRLTQAAKERFLFQTPEQILEGVFNAASLARFGQDFGSYYYGTTRGDNYQVIRRSVEALINRPGAISENRDGSDYFILWGNPDTYVEGTSRAGGNGDALFSFAGFWSRFPNDNNNNNRKRAAFILDRIFCDDMKPISIPEATENNPQEVAAGTDPHLRNTACEGCHVRLDPMAGFFKDFSEDGSIGVGEQEDFVAVGLEQPDLQENLDVEVRRDQNGRPLPDFIRFDDITVSDAKQLETYRNRWLARGALAQKRKFNIGYVISKNDLSRNSYGESLNDLLRIIRERVEAKQCFVKRLFQKLVGENQAVDSEWLNHIAGELHQKTLKNPTQSAEYVKDTIRTILLSRAYRTGRPNRDSSVCYDYHRAPNPNSPPCQIRGVLEANCIECHNADYNEGGLILSQWGQVGESFNFNHVRNGQRLGRVETFSAILKSLETSNTNAKAGPTRMPKDQHISPNDQVTLKSWIQKQLEAK